MYPTYLDFLAAAVIVFSMLLGIRAGLLGQGQVAASLLLGTVVATVLAKPAGRLLAPVFPAGSRGPVVLAFFVVFCAVSLSLRVLALWGSAATKRSGMDWCDNVLGGALGAAKGLVLSAAMVLVFSRFPTGRTVVERSAFCPLLVTAAAAVLPGESAETAVPGGPGTACDSHHGD